MKYIKVGVAVFHKGDKILFLRAKKHDNKLTLISGTLEDGETFVEGTIREAMEEIGVGIVEASLIEEINNEYSKQDLEGIRFQIKAFDIKRYTGTPIILEPEKHTEILWLDKEEVEKFIINDEVTDYTVKNLREIGFIDSY